MYVGFTCLGFSFWVSLFGFNHSTKTQNCILVLRFWFFVLGFSVCQLVMGKIGKLFFGFMFLGFLFGNH